MNSVSLAAGTIGVGLLVLSYLLSGSEQPISLHAQKGYHAIFASCAVILIIVWRWLRPWVGRLLLTLLLAATVANVLLWSPQRLDHIDQHDVTCYYLGAKYAPEISVYGLYPAVVAADRELRRYARMRDTYWSQGRNGFKRARLKHALREGRRLKKKKFSRERWQDFRRDVDHLQKELGRNRFRGFLRDKGFNATPGWLLYAHPLANRIPVDQVARLARLDVYLLAAAFGFVGVTFGLNTLLWVLMFFAVTISTKWLIPGSVILRYDWVAMLLLGMCFLKRKMHVAAGIATGLAGLFRIFPVVWMYGPAARLGALLLSGGKSRRLQRVTGLVAMLLAFAVTIAVWEGAALARFGTDLAVDQAIKMRDHTSPEMISSKRPGLAIALSYDGEVSRPRMHKQQRARIREATLYRNALAGLLLLALGWALRKKSTVEAYAFGYIPFFLLSTGTYYYHVARLTLVLMHAFALVSIGSQNRARDILRHQVGLGFLFALEIHSQLMFYYFDDQQVFWTGWLSRALTLYCLGMTVWIYIENHRDKNLVPGGAQPAETQAPRVTDQDRSSQESGNTPS